MLQKFFRRRGTSIIKRARSYQPICEALEPRWNPVTASYNPATQLLTVQMLPTENVTISQAAGRPLGHLQVSGTAFNTAVPTRFVKDVLVKVATGNGDNSITVEDGPGTALEIAGSLTITSQASEGTDVILDGVVNIGKNLKVTGGGGADTANVDAFIGGNVTMNLGGGANSVVLENAIGGNVSVKTTGGSNSVVVNGGLIGGNLTCQLAGLDGTLRFEVSPSTVGGSILYVGSTGADSILINQAVTIHGSLSAQLAGGANALEMLPGTALEVGGSLTYSGAGGTDAVDLTDLLAFRKLAVNLGNGTNTFDIANSYVSGSMALVGGNGVDDMVFDVLTVRKNLSVSLGGGPTLQTLTADSLDVQGNLTLLGGSGNDNFDLQSSFLGVDGATTIKTLGGDDTVTLGDGFLLGAVTISTAAGDDTISLDSFSIGSPLSFASRLTILGGADADTLNLGLSGSSSLLFGGPTTFNGGGGVNNRNELGTLDFNGGAPVISNWPI